MIKVKNLTKLYGRTLAVDDISFHVSAGSVVGFLGPNGAGKSTTLRILTCFLPATSGTARVDGDLACEATIRFGIVPAEMLTGQSSAKS